MLDNFIPINIARNLEQYQVKDEKMQTITELLELIEDCMLEVEQYPETININTLLEKDILSFFFGKNPIKIIDNNIFYLNEKVGIVNNKKKTISIINNDNYRIVLGMINTNYPDYKVKKVKIL